MMGSDVRLQMAAVGPAPNGPLPTRADTLPLRDGCRRREYGSHTGLLINTGSSEWLPLAARLVREEVV